jgi:hypothetical protein
LKILRVFISYQVLIGVYLGLFVLELDWEKSRRRSGREKAKNSNRTLDRTRRCSTTASGSGHHQRVRSREGGPRGSLTGRWTGRDAATSVSGPGLHLRVRSHEVGSRVDL